MRVLEKRLVENREFVRKERRLKSLAPDLAVDFRAEALRDFVGGEPSVREHDALENRGVAVRAHDLFKGFLKFPEALGTNGKARGHGVAAEADDDAGKSL